MQSRGPAGSGPDSARTIGDRLASSVRTIRDFPREGIIFRDITTLLADPAAFREAIDALAAAFRDAHVDIVAGIESRGFVLGGAVARQLETGFVPVRKEGRLPAETISVAYSLEYGQAVLEIHADALRRGQRVLIIDDLLATGGTAAATVKLVGQLGGVVAGLAFLIELSDMGGAAALGHHQHVSLISF